MVNVPKIYYFLWILAAFMTLNTVTAVDEVTDEHEVPIAIGCTFMGVGVGNLTTVGFTGECFCLP